MADLSTREARVAAFRAMTQDATLDTPQKRVAALLALVPKREPVAIRTVAEALAWGDKWQQTAERLQANLERLQMLLMCAQIHEKASDTLREFAEDELKKIRG